MSSSKGIDNLHKSIKGEVYLREDNDYENSISRATWNGRIPDRRPAALVVAKCQKDVITSINFARKNSFSISCKTGGHSHSVCFLQENCILLDLSKLNELKVDPNRRVAYVQPGVTSAQLNSSLSSFSLAFPTGHDGDVTMAGFLLGGGLGINCAAWGGMSTFNIEAVDVIMPSGKHLHANCIEHPEILWAARGGASGLFFCVVGLYLKCYERPHIITTNNYVFGFSSLPKLVEKLNNISSKIAPSLQVMITIPTAPTSLVNTCRPEDHGRLTIVSAIAFASDKANEQNLHALLDESLSVMPEVLSIDRGLITDFDCFYKNSKLMQTCGRWVSDNILTNDITPAAKIILKHLPLSPSPSSQPLIVLQKTKHLPEAAYSAVGDFYVSTYAQWEGKENDNDNTNWLYQFYADLQRYASGFYINELDREHRKKNIPLCYSSGNWTKLKSLKTKYDPDDVFLGFNLEN
jgi:FAD/FMN-containing dehydrogenase